MKFDRMRRHQIAGLADIADIRVCDLTRDESVAAMATRVLAGLPPRFALAGISLGGYVALEMIRQDAVFDRAEQRRDDAEAEQRDKEKGDRLARIAGDRDAGDGDFDEFQPLRDTGLVVAIGQFAA